MILELGKFTDQAQELIVISQEILIQYGHNRWDVEHLFIALIQKNSVIMKEIIRESKIDISNLKVLLNDALENSNQWDNALSQIVIMPRLSLLFENAQKEARRLNDEYVGIEHILVSLSQVETGPAFQIMSDIGITTEKIYKALRIIRSGHRITDKQSDNRYGTLRKFSIDLTQLANEGKLDPIVGRDKEIVRVMQTLIRRTKNNPILIGGAGVGKTAIAEGLAQKIISKNAPKELIGKKVIALDLASMVAGSKFRGEFEERFKDVINEVVDSEGEIILFIDEIHTLVGAGASDASMDASNMIKPALARGELQCLGATTEDEYTQHIESDAALERRFQSVVVEEPDIETAIKMLKVLKPRYENHHNVKILDQTLKSAVVLSQRYITNRLLPDKAIDLIDEAASKIRIDYSYASQALQGIKNTIESLKYSENEAVLIADYEKAAKIKTRILKAEEDANGQANLEIDLVVKPEDIGTLVSLFTGIPVERLLKSESERLIDMETKLHTRIVGQNDAVSAVSNAIRRSRAGLKDFTKPIGSFMFLGPTGVGKTELAKSLSWFLFDDPEKIVRIDMSEYMEAHSVSRLIGAPPGYIGYQDGGQLTEAVRRRPYRVVLLDEIEKAHPDVFNILLQLLDDGRLTDGQGRTVDFTNTVIIMTSNLGTSAENSQPLGFIGSSDKDGLMDRSIRDKIEQSVKKEFKPEFLNRLDELIIFESITSDQQEKIIEIMIESLKLKLTDSNITIFLESSAKLWLAEKGFDKQYGARPLRRTIQKYLENPLATLILNGDILDGDSVSVLMRESGLSIEINL
jgi:ATP-dependent Clp protease ATP-binding subunit ClpC